MISTVLFDMDGVLCDSEAVLAEAAVAFFHELGAVDVTAEDFRAFVGAGENRYIGGVAELHGVELDIEQAKKTVYERYLKIIPERLRAFPGAVELVLNCRRQGWRVGLVSSADKVKIRGNLAAAGFAEEWFDVIISGEDVAVPKPKPDIYLIAARRLHVDPQECCVVEDAIHGIEAARNAGMRVIAVATSFPKEKLAQADHICESVAGISPQLIRQVMDS